MVIAIVCIAFALVALLELWPAWKMNSRRENTFYVVCIVISLTIVLLRSMELALPDPTKLLADWLHSIGVER